MRATALIGVLALLWGSGFFWIKLSLKGLRRYSSRSPDSPGRARPRADRAHPSLAASPRLDHMGHLAVSALVANAIPYTLFATANRRCPPAWPGLSTQPPLWTVLVAIAARADTRLTPRRGLGVLVGFLGLLVIFEPWNASTGGAVGGVLACLGAAMSYGFGYVYQARFLTNRGLSPLTLTAAQLVLASAILGLALPASGGLRAQPSALALIAVLILGAIGTGVALVINFTLIGTEGPTAASVVTYLIPAVALALGILILGEPARLTLPLGALLILIGVALVRRRRPLPSVD